MDKCVILVIYKYLYSVTYENTPMGICRGTYVPIFPFVSLFHKDGTLVSSISKLQSMYVHISFE